MATLAATGAACTLLELPPRSDLAAPGVTALVTSLPAPYGLAVDGTSIYWSDANGVHAASKQDGAGRRDLYTTEAGATVGEVAANQNAVFWIEAAGAGARIAQWTDGATTFLGFEGGTRADHLAAAGGVAFAAAGAVPRIYALPSLEALAVDAAAAGPGSLWVATDGTHVAEVTVGGIPFLAEADGGMRAPARTLPPGPGAGPIATISALVFISSDGGTLREYARVPDGAYFNRSLPPIGATTSLAVIQAQKDQPVTIVGALEEGGVVSVQTSGGGVRSVSPPFGTSARAVCADATAAYWIELDASGDGTIFKWVDAPDAAD